MLLLWVGPLCWLDLRVVEVLWLMERVHMQVVISLPDGEAAVRLDHVAINLSTFFFPSCHLVLPSQLYTICHIARVHPKQTQIPEPEGRKRL